MQRIAAASVIRGAGSCEVYMKYLVGEEMKRLNAISDKENAQLRQRMAVVTGSRNKLLGDKLKRLNTTPRRKPVHKRVLDKIVKAYSVFFALCLELGFIEYVGNGNKRRRRK